MKLKKKDNGLGKSRLAIEMVKSFEEEKPKDNPKEEDWNFDFSMYEKEEKITEDNLTSITDKKPKVSNFVSKYNASIETIQLLVNIRTTLSDKSIAVASRSGDMKDIRDLYGCLNEAWAIIKDIYGSLIIKEIDNLDKVIIRNIRIAQRNSSIPDKLYRLLLLYRDKVYMLIQRSKLGFEVEKNRGSAFKKAKAGMVE